jgi:hypothetical protein
MTYTQAIENNKKFNLHQTWKNSKEFADGKYLRWVQSPDGKIGFLIRGNVNGVLIGYPIKVLKNSYYLTTECCTNDVFQNFELIKS